jgi:undecaprenyl-diphosphatase
VTDSSRTRPSAIWAVIAVLAVALGAVTLWATAGVPAWDAELSRAAQELDTGVIGLLAMGFNAAGSLPVTIVVAVACVIIALRWDLSVMTVAAALLLAEIITTVLKQVVGRPRPPGADLEGMLDPGYPSGHVARIAAVCVVIGVLWLARRRGWAWWVVLVGLVAGMAAARVIAGSHYVTDTLGGLLVGLLVGALVLAWEDRRVGGAERSGSGSA